MAGPSFVIARHPNGSVHVNQMGPTLAAAMQPACGKDTRLEDSNEPVFASYALDDPEAPPLTCTDCERILRDARWEAADSL